MVYLPAMHRRWPPIVLALTVLTFAWLYEPDRPVEALKARWAPPPSRFLAVAGVQAHLRDVGPREDPEPLLLLHGTSASLHTWEGWVDALSDSERVITVDLPGFGLTGPNPSGDYSAAAYTGFVVALLDALELRSVVVAGNSLGGNIAWELALAAPERVSRLILVDAAGYPRERSVEPIGFRVARTPGLRRVADVILPRSIVEKSVRSVYGDPSRVTPELVDRYFELTLREGNRHALAARLSQWSGGEDSARISQVTQPTLILWGDKDQLIPPEHGERFHRDIAGSVLVSFPGLGHVPQEEDPATSVAAVQRFLAGGSPGAN